MPTAMPQPDDSVGPVDLTLNLLKVQGYLLMKHAVACNARTPQPEPKWRVITTDAEMASGVAPICPSTSLIAVLGNVNEHWNGESMDLLGVWDCCPGPHLQCINEHDAQRVMTMLNVLEVEICS